MLRYLICFIFLSSIFAVSQESEEAKKLTSKMSSLVNEKEALENVNEELFEQYKNHLNIYISSANNYSLIKAYRNLLDTNIRIAKSEMKKVDCESIYSVDNLKSLSPSGCIFVSNLNLQKNGKKIGKGVYKGSKIIVLNVNKMNIEKGILKYKSYVKNVYTFEYLGAIVDQKFEGVFISSIIASEIHNLLNSATKNLQNDAKAQMQVSEDSDQVVKNVASKLQNVRGADYYLFLGNLKEFLKDLRKENGGITDLIDVYKSDAYFLSLLFAVSTKSLQADKEALLIYKKAYVNNYKKAKSSYENYYKSLVGFNKEMQDLKNTKNYFAGLVVKMQQDAYEDILKNNKKIGIFNQDIKVINKKYKIYQQNNKQLAKIRVQPKPAKIEQSQNEQMLYKTDIELAYKNKYVYKEIEQDDKLKKFLMGYATYNGNKLPESSLPSSNMPDNLSSDSSSLYSGFYFGMFEFVDIGYTAVDKKTIYGADFSMGYFYKHFGLGLDVAKYKISKNEVDHSAFVNFKYNFNAISFTGLYFLLGYGYMDMRNSSNPFAKFIIGANVPLVKFGNTKSNIVGLDFSIGYLADLDDVENSAKENKITFSLGLLFSF